ncbi:hypothetical protein FB45DRAFT_945576 [Roridomyces roridus]|nr:hypothetical protein FB45DRAFT_945576 [Roridomyces roridus]
MHQRFLKLATNLVEATILVQTSSAPWPAPLDESIDLLHLQRLNVSEIKVLDYIRAPALSEIGVGLAGEDPFECLDPFILRSSCTPSRLCITGCPDANTTAAILKKYPLITSLNLMFCSDDNEAVDEHSTMLTVGVPPLVSPHLYEIRFGIVPPMRVDYPLFLKMLQSRRREPYRALGVAEFLAYGDHDVDPVTLVGMDSLREGGLHLVVESDQKTCIDRWVYSCPWN